MSSSKRKIADLLNDEDPRSSKKPHTIPQSDSTSPHTANISPVSEHKLAYPQTLLAPPKPTPFQQPSPLITFSYTPSRTLEFNDSALRYFVEPPPRAQLGYAYERWVRRPEEKGRVDGLVKALDRVRQDSVGRTLDVGVVSWRGVITKILTSPYEEREGWELNVMFMDGTMYFEEHLSDARLQEKNDMEPRHRLQSYYGYAFESYCTSATPVRQHTENGWGGDVDTNVQWCSVVKTKLGDTRMVIGGEVDCVRGTYNGQTDKFVELKTSMVIRGSHDEAKFEKKLLKFYFQSFLLGVPEIMVGFRTPAGQVQTVQPFKTIQIPRLVRGKPGAWDPLVCLDWGDRFLTFLKDALRRDTAEPDRVWRVKFVPQVGVSVRLIDKADVSDIEGGEDRVGFLPRWYWDAVQKDSRRAGQALPSLGWQI